ncbi:MAG: 1-acyl-sn-glycerol-3-phosphate acyltransferase [Bacteroidales bacterium]|nr:1-acyl-sn-glycerol-3-phosphate acyltransferase [Bacteroidales bacterium]
MDRTEPQLVNVDRVLRSKAGRAYRLIPKPLIRYLERIVHQDEINEAMVRLKDLRGLDFVRYALIDHFDLDIEVIHPENIPGPGRFIVASNHPLGGLDGMALMHVIGKKRPDLKFISNDILLELNNLKDLFIAVNKHGRTNIDMVRALEEDFASDILILIFPAGLVSRKRRGVIKDLEWKKTFISKAVQHNRDIIPVYIEGRNSTFFYNLANWRKRLGIKMNVEMLYLPDEMFRQQNKKLTITFGKPIAHTVFTKKLSHQQWAQKVKEHVYALPGGRLEFSAEE